MAFKVIFSEQAENDLLRIIDYLYVQWGPDVSLKFHLKVASFIKTVAVMPTIGRKHIRKWEEFREYSVTKQNIIIYQIKNDEITILKIFDVRQHPAKKYKNIK